MCFDGCIKRGKVEEKWDFGDAEKMSESFRRKLRERLQKNDIQKVYLFVKWTCGISRNEIKEIVLTSFCVKATNPFFSIATLQSFDFLTSFSLSDIAADVLGDHYIILFYCVQL